MSVLHGARCARADWRRAAAVTLLAVLSLTACGGDDVLLRRDDRLVFLAPAARSQVDAPITVRWALRENVDAAAFVVVVDRSPQPPGKGLDYFVRNDSTCDGPGLAACLEPAALANRRIFRTTRTELTLEALAPRTNISESFRHRHDVTIVVVGTDGRRIGESAWTLTFEVTEKTDEDLA